LWLRSPGKFKTAKESIMFGSLQSSSIPATSQNNLAKLHRLIKSHNKDIDCAFFVLKSDKTPNVSRGREMGEEEEWSPSRVQS